jgi:hypothetical protein
MLAASISAAAEERKSELSIRLGAGGFFLTKADNLWGSGHKTLRSLNSSPKSATVVVPFPFLDARLTRPKGEGWFSGTQFYFNTGMSEPGALVFGARSTTRFGTLDTYLFYSLVSRAWENPYVPYREATRQREYGIRIAGRELFGTRLNLSYRLGAVDVKDDVIGDLSRDLQRDGFTHTGSVGYSFSLGKGVDLTPAFTYEKGAFKGKSNSYDQFEGSVTLSYAAKDLFFSVKANANTADFDRRHPIYNKTRDEKTYSLSSQITFENPFGFKKYFATLGAAGSTTDSNIRFFDKHSLFGFIAGGYRF